MEDLYGVASKILGGKFQLKMETPPQRYTGTKLGRPNAVPKPLQMIPFKEGTVNLDLGGGAGSAVTEYLAERGVRNLVYDPFARSKTHNKNILKELRRIYGADTVTCMNVLNIILEPSVRLAVVRNCYRALKPKGTAYFYCQEGSKRGIPSIVQDNHYATNRRSVKFIPYIREVFPFVFSHQYYIEARKIINKEFHVEPLIIDDYYYD